MKLWIVPLLLCFALLATASAPAQTTSWPNWLGPKHDGVSHEKGWSSDWPADGLKKVWSREIGIGFSSVSLADDVLYTMGHVKGTEYVYAIEATTGEKVWSHSYECELVDNLHEGGPGATPTIDGEVLYTLGRGGQLFCLNRTDGKVIWEKDLRTDLEVRLHEWGFCGSPYILGDQLLLEAGRVVSYDKHTGKKNWQTAKHKAGYGSVAPFKHKGETLLATLDCDGLRVTRAKDGSEIDFVGWKSPYRTNSTTPIIRGDKIFISSGYNVGAGLFQLVDGKLKEIYTTRKMRNHFNNSILWGDYLYGFDGNSNLGRVVQLTCIQWDTGEVAWQKRGFGCGSLMVADGKLLILSEDGKLVVVDASPEKFNQLAESEILTGRCWTIPVLLDRHVYARNAAGDLVCFQLPSTKK